MSYSLFSWMKLVHTCYLAFVRSSCEIEEVTMYITVGSLGFVFVNSSRNDRFRKFSELHESLDAINKGGVIVNNAR